MKGKLEKIGNKWFVRYVRYEGGGSFRLPLHPNFIEMTEFVYIKNGRYYDGDEIDFTEALVNPMGRDVDSNNLGQNHSLCKWYARPYLDEKEDLMMEVPMAQYPKEEQKQHIVDMMKSDEELGLYDENSPFYNHQVRLVNDLAKKIKLEQELGLYDEPGIKEIKEIKLEDVFNDEKRERVNRVIQQHKVLKDLTLINPAHLIMTSDGYGEFPDGYKLTEKGIQYIINQLNKE
jgi:hypothetical protein